MAELRNKSFKKKNVGLFTEKLCIYDVFVIRKDIPNVFRNSMNTKWLGKCMVEFYNRSK